MKRLQRLISIARADFRQRFRNRTLLAVPVLIAYLGHLITGEGVTFVVGSYTGAATAAWFAGVTALAGTALLVIFGFYLVTGTIERDRRTGVGALVATTPIRGSTYVFGKWLSHVALLAVLVGTLALATLGTFLLRGSGPLALWPVVSPFLLVTLPAMTLVGAVAVLFETIRPLRATAGKVAYFVLAMTAFAMASAGILPGAMDPFGFGLIRESMVSSLVAQTPETTSPQTFAFTNMEATAGTFRWPGITWTFWQVGERLTLVILATILVTAAGMAFDRFAPVTAETSDTADRSDRSPTMDAPSVDVPSPATPGPAAAILVGIPPIAHCVEAWVVSALAWRTPTVAARPSPMVVRRSRYPYCRRRDRRCQYSDGSYLAARMAVAAADLGGSGGARTPGPDRTACVHVPVAARTTRIRLAYRPARCSLARRRRGSPASRGRCGNQSTVTADWCSVRSIAGSGPRQSDGNDPSVRSGIPVFVVRGTHRRGETLRLHSHCGHRILAGVRRWDVRSDGNWFWNSPAVPPALT